MKKNTLAFLGNGRSAGNMLSETVAYRLFHEGHQFKRFHFGGIENQKYADLIKRDCESQFWALFGHLVFGVDRLLGRELDYFMNLRETGDRLASKARQWVGNKEPEAFIRDDWDCDNGITKRLSGYYEEDGHVYDMMSKEALPICVEREFVTTEEVYQRALENKNKVPVVLIKERMAESLVWIETFFDLPPIFCFRFFNYNRSTGGPVILDPFLEEVRALNQYDRNLYDMYDRDLSNWRASLDQETETVITARQLVMDAVFGYGEDEKTVFERTFSLANELFSKGENDLGFEVIYLITINPSIAKPVKETFAKQMQQLPPSRAKEKALSAVHSPKTLSARWLE